METELFGKKVLLLILLSSRFLSVTFLYENAKVKVKFCLSLINKSLLHENIWMNDGRGAPFSIMPLDEREFFSFMSGLLYPQRNISQY
jgi:predicted AAA+ superfamily ATPase